MGGLGALDKHERILSRFPRARRHALRGRSSGPCACCPLTLLLRARWVRGGAHIGKICGLATQLVPPLGPKTLTFACNAVSAPSAARRPSRSCAAWPKEVKKRDTVGCHVNNTGETSK